MRPICPVCKQKPKAINYHKEDQIHYRSRCESCIRRGRNIKPQTPRWQSAGYKKKPTCDRCGFRAKYGAQLMVFHIDSNLNNSDPRNLKTVCLNCTIELSKTDSIWRPGDLAPDY